MHLRGGVKSRVVVITATCETHQDLQANIISLISVKAVLSLSVFSNCLTFAVLAGSPIDIIFSLFTLNSFA